MLNIINLFTSITAGAIGEALMENKTLKNLSLEYNKNITRKKDKTRIRKKKNIIQCEIITMAMV